LGSSVELVETTSGGRRSSLSRPQAAGGWLRPFSFGGEGGSVPGRRCQPRAGGRWRFRVDYRLRGSAGDTGNILAEKFSVSFQRNLPIRLWISGVSVGGG
jgi:hypothetical protein